MAHSIEDHLNALKAAADRAYGTMWQQASAETNREAYRALMADCFVWGAFVADLNKPVKAQ